MFLAQKQYFLERSNEYELKERLVEKKKNKNNTPHLAQGGSFIY